MLLDARTLCSNSFWGKGAPNCKPSIRLKIAQLVFYCFASLCSLQGGIITYWSWHNVTLPPPNLLHCCEMQVHHSVIPIQLLTHLGGQKQCRLSFHGPLTNTCTKNLPIISHNRCTINIVCKPFMLTLYLILPSHAPLYCISTILFARQLMTSRDIALGYVWPSVPHTGSKFAGITIGHMHIAVLCTSWHSW